jgi:uncharacterized repeat protein (TIGR03803 family)
MLEASATGNASVSVVCKRSNQMNSLTLSRCALGVCVAATLLVGCGGLQPVGTQGPVPQGKMPESPSRVSGVRQSPRSVRHPSVTETVLYSFGGGPDDGGKPQSGLTYFNGTFFGTTTEGGVGDCYTPNIGCGTVYSITPSGTETVLYSFKGQKDGASPEARLIVRNGTFYGTTYSRGGCHQRTRTGGCGTVFSITPSGHVTVLHGFAGPPDGANPEAPLRNVNGTLYGTTSEGGSSSSCPSSGCGTVFSITPGGKEKVLYSFRNGIDGAQPIAGLIDVKGTLYGTTFYGGAYRTYYCPCGTVFTVTPSGKEKVLHSFGNGKDGTRPDAALVEVKSTLYGTTGSGGSATCGSKYGCGTVFSVTPSGRETVLHSFSGGDGDSPQATLLNVNGTLYGTTFFGGAYNDGTVFSITLSGHETVLYSFKGGQDGSGPDSGLSYVNGTLYGTTVSGGGGNGCGGDGCGTVYSITP